MPPERFGTFPSGRSSTDAFSDKNLFHNSFLLPLMMAMDEEEKRRRRLRRRPVPQEDEDELAAFLRLVVAVGGRDPFSFLTGTKFQKQRTTGSTLAGGTFTNVRRR